MGRGIIDAEKLRTERYQFTTRTTDPANTREGEGWIRSDISPETDQIGTLRFDTGGGSTFDLPIFDASAASSKTGSDVEAHLRVTVGSTQGFVPTTDDGAAFPKVGVYEGGVRYGAHDPLELNAIPDSVVSRPDDDSTFTQSISAGLVIQPASDFDAIAARISANTSGTTRARLYDYDPNVDAYVMTVDISGLSAGDTFSFDYNFKAGSEYGFELDDDGVSYRSGFITAIAYPYTSSDIDIIARSENGTQIDDGTPSSNVANINDIGNPDNVLG